MGAPPTIELGSLGMADSLILMVLALVVFGPRRLPQIGRQIGKLMYEFRKASNDFKFQMEEELRLAEEADRRKKEEEERKRVAALAASSQASVSASPAQTVEAQADIGPVEPPTASAEPGAAEVSVESGPEAIAPSPEPLVTTPMLQPPLTGEQVSAARPSGIATETTSLSPETPSPAANNGAHPEPALDAVKDVSGPRVTPVEAADLESATPPKEPVTQHG